MRKIGVFLLSAGLVSSLFVISPVSANEIENVEAYMIDSQQYDQMKDAGMTDEEIQTFEHRNAEDLNSLSDGSLEQKVENDLASNQNNNILKENELQATAAKASSSVLGSYGDVLIAYSASSWGINFGYPGHAAIVAVANNRTVESFPADGVQYHTNDWRNRSKVYAARVKGATATKYNKAASYAASQIGKDYNWNFVNAMTTDRFYCSQLVWRAWKEQGIDIDYVTIDPIVSPMEIAKSGNISIYYSN